MSTMPKFSLNASNINFDTDEELQAELAKKGGKYFDEPGKASLTITTAAPHPNKTTGEIFCAGDPTWFNVKLTLTDKDGREVDHWLQVPTTSIEFGPKRTLALFRKLQEFFIGLGETVTIAKVQGLLEKYFTDPKKLVGKQVDVELGYEGPYVTKAPGSEQYVVMVKGVPLKDDDGKDATLPDRSSAVQYAKSQGIAPSFLRVIKFNPKKATKPSKAAAAEW